MGAGQGAVRHRLPRRAYRQRVRGVPAGRTRRSTRPRSRWAGSFAADPSLATLRSVGESVWVFQPGGRSPGHECLDRHPGSHRRGRGGWARGACPRRDRERDRGLRALPVGRLEPEGHERPGHHRLLHGPGRGPAERGDVPGAGSSTKLDAGKGGLIDIDQWRRTLGLAGTHFAEQYPGVSPSRTDTDQLIASATALSPAADLDVDPYQRGEFHVSLELVITQSHELGQLHAERSPRPTTKTGSSRLRSRSSRATWRKSPRSPRATWKALRSSMCPSIRANTVQGRYYLLLVHDANNGVALYRHWVRGGGGERPCGCRRKLG